MVDASIHLIDRGRVYADRGYVVDGYTMGSATEPNPDHERAEFVVWNAVIDHPEATVLCDTGSHPEAGDGYWPAPLYAAFEHVDAADHDLEGDLDDAGFGLDDIDAVVTSHLHLDHAAGWRRSRGPTSPCTSTRRS